MVFSSAAFLFLFLPVFLGMYYLLPFRFRSAWILAASWIFYAWWRVDFLALIVLTTIWTYLIGKAVAAGLESSTTGAGNSEQRAQTSEEDKSGLRAARRYLTLGVVLNIGVLAYFKYFNFGVDSLNALLSSFRIPPLDAWRVILPIGISFYLFQATSYLVDLYRKDAPPAKDYVSLAAFISLFPQLIAGPILRYKNMAGQFEYREHTMNRLSSGAVRFMRGFAKKVLIADTVAVIADSAFLLSAPTVVDAWLGALAFGIQLYFDFSGYSDMAIGLGRMIGFEFPENFDSPYRSRSITEFWRRWHISLSSWLRDYLYIPLGGSRRGVGRTYVNLLLVMTLGGLWHGASWSFVAWGLFHGLVLVYERRFAGGQSLLPGVLASIRTTVLVLAGWVLFRAETIETAFVLYGGMIGLNGFALSDELAWQLPRLSIAALAVGTLITHLPLARLKHMLIDKRPLSFKAISTNAGVILVFLLSVMKMLADSFSPFLYFQF